MLKEVIDRLILPPLDAVPDEMMVAAAREGIWCRARLSGVETFVPPHEEGRRQT